MYKHRARTPVAASVWFYYVLRSYRDHPRASVYIFLLNNSVRAVLLVRREPLCIYQCIIRQKVYTHARAHIHIYIQRQNMCKLSLSLSRTHAASDCGAENRFECMALDFFPITEMIYSS